MNWSSNPAPDTDFARREDALTALRSAASQRILLIDGAMGTQIQCLNLDEKNFRGDRFHSCDRLLQGNNDLLTLTQPQAIEDIHLAYALAGADILETNTFSSTSIAQADYGMEDEVYELNRDGARLARRAAIKAEKADGRRRFVAGALGPTNRTASLSPDVNNPGFRAVSFDDLRIAYGEQIKGLIDGGADILLIETIFDTLNAKAAIFACFEAFTERGFQMPIMISGHHHRSLGTHAFRPDADGVLAFGAPCAPLLHRPQLRAWRKRDARASGGDLRRGRHARVRLSERRPAQRLRPI